MKTFKRYVWCLLVVVLLSGCAGAIGTSPKGLEVPIETAALKLATDIKEGGYRVVATAELKTWLDANKKLTIVSTLPVADDDAFGKLPGARNAEMPKSEKDLTAALREQLLKVAGNDREQTIVVYCGFVSCRRSHVGAKLLVENGYANVYRYPAGVAGWGEAGYPLFK